MLKVDINFRRKTHRSKPGPHLNPLIILAFIVSPASTKTATHRTEFSSWLAGVPSVLPLQETVQHCGHPEQVYKEQMQIVGVETMRIARKYKEIYLQKSRYSNYF